MVSSLIKRLELLFLCVFACPKASRIQFTCIFHPIKRKYYFTMSFKMILIDHSFKFHFLPLDVNVHLLTGSSVFTCPWMIGAWSDPVIDYIRMTSSVLLLPWYTPLYYLTDVDLLNNVLRKLNILWSIPQKCSSILNVMEKRAPAENGLVLKNQHQRDQNLLNGNVDHSIWKFILFFDKQLEENTEQRLRTVVN